MFQVDKVEAPAPLEGQALEALKRQLKIFVGEDIIGEYFSALEARYGVTINRQALTKTRGWQRRAMSTGSGRLRHASAAARWRSDRARLLHFRPPV